MAKALTVKELSREHATYADLKADWERMRLLSVGGHELRKRAAEFLRRRPRELQEVYQARLDRFSYHNILGTCFGWYKAALFKNPPTISMRKAAGPDGSPGAELEGAEAKFYVDFRKNCDNCGTSFVDVLRGVWNDLALYRSAYLLIDLPKADEARNLRDQKKAGVLDEGGKPRPHLVPYSPASVINWDVDRYGNLNWAVIAQQEQRHVFGEKSKTVDVWYFFDKTSFVRYERERQDGEELKPDQDAVVQAAAEGQHALAKAGMVPLLRFEIDDGLWLANRALLPTQDHLNQDNAYGWALFMANLAMPVIKSDQDIKPTLSESGFIQLPQGAEYGWSEPEGKSFERAANRVRELREEIYRAMYLTYQGKTSNATADGASGASKEMDMMPAQDVMNDYGDTVVAAAQRTLDAVAVARGDEARADVRGLTFGKTATLEQIELAAAALELDLGSETFEREVKKQVAAGFLPDANPETIETIHDEIEVAPTRQEKAEADAKKRQDMFGKALSSDEEKWLKGGEEGGPGDDQPPAGQEE